MLLPGGPLPSGHFQLHTILRLEKEILFDDPEAYIWVTAHKYRIVAKCLGDIVIPDEVDARLDEVDARRELFRARLDRAISREEEALGELRRKRNKI